MGMTDYEIPRPTAGDVVDLILDDHRLFEALLRDLRDATADREAARAALAAVLIAHGEAEEAKVYPSLERKDAITAHEAEHGEEEHAEGNEALLALLECKGTDTQKFDDAVEDLATALNHHIGEEEQTILNPARTDVSRGRPPGPRRGVGRPRATSSSTTAPASIDQRPRDRRQRAQGGPAAGRRRGRVSTAGATPEQAPGCSAASVPRVTTSTRRCVCPGSYDPVTLGHVDVIRRAAALYDEVVVAVLHNPAKRGTFTAEERVDLLARRAGATCRTSGSSRSRGRLLVDVCREVGATAIVKGLRGGTDFAYELPMALMNRHLTGVETVFLPGDPSFEHVSSSLVKEVARLGGDVDGPGPRRRAARRCSPGPPALERLSRPAGSAAGRDARIWAQGRPPVISCVGLRPRPRRSPSHSTSAGAMEPPRPPIAAGLRHQGPRSATRFHGTPAAHGRGTCRLRHGRHRGPAGVQPLELDLRLESVVEGVLVTGSVRATATGACVRCLDPVSRRGRRDLPGAVRLRRSRGPPP